MADQPILDLHTLVCGQPVRIDGRLYQIHHPDRLTLQDTLRLEALTPRLGARMVKVTTLTTEEYQALHQELADLCGIVLDAPAAVQRKLSDAQRLRITQAFTALWTTARRRTRAKAPATRSTGATSSRGSRASTAGPRLNGSRTSRAGS